MKEITYGDLLDCYNTLLEYAGKQRWNVQLEQKRSDFFQAFIDGKIDSSFTGPIDDDRIASARAALDDAKETIATAQRKVEAAREVIADFYFDGDKEAAQDVIEAMAKYLDYEDKAAEALAEWAPPIQERGTVITW